MVLNNVTKFHKILIKNIRVRERTSFKTVNFHKQRAITLESWVRYGPLSNLKKTSYLRVPQSAGQVKILIFLEKITFFPFYANKFCDAGQVPILRYFEA